MSELLNVDEAIARILARITRLGTEEIEIESALGRVLAQDIRAEINLPPFANSSMDGFAVRSVDTVAANKDMTVDLEVVMDIPAGTAPQKSVKAFQAARIMTGAPMPKGADAVVPVEDTNADWSKGDSTPPDKTVSIKRSVKTGDYVRPIGEDIQQGETVLRAGIVLRPQEIGVIAALGYPRIQVIERPLVAILTTGDELVTVDQPLTPGKIRDINTHTLTGLVHTYGGTVYPLPIAGDTLEDVRNLFHSALQPQPHLLISSAGVSVGAADLIRTVLDEMGEVNFWRINLRPGKPLAFGIVRDTPFFGLPGNPVSAMVTFEVLVRPALLKMAGGVSMEQTITAKLAEDITSDGRRSFLRVKLQREGDEYLATTTGTQSSGALMSMVLADGLLIVPEGTKKALAGETFTVRLLKPLSV